jgi:hypothetical protein
MIQTHSAVVMMPPTLHSDRSWSQFIDKPAVDFAPFVSGRRTLYKSGGIPGAQGGSGHALEMIAEQASERFGKAAGIQPFL